MDAIVTQLIAKRNKQGISVPKLAKELDIPADRIYKWEQGHGNPKGTDIDKIKSWLEEIPNTSNDTDTALPPGQPLIQVVLNLSYIGKKNADSIDKMADSNLLNAKSIATLVNLIASNSDLAALLAAAPSAPHTEDVGLPAEAFLGKGGTDFLEKQRLAGKRATKSK